MKNHRQFLVTIAALFVFFSLSAQSGLIKGQILDKNNEQALGYATISLYTKSDSALVNGATTDDQGVFTMNADQGSYYAVVSFISYKNLNIPDIEVTGKSATVDLGKIFLVSDATVLAEVEVRAEKSVMQMSLDKRIFNVGKDLANSGGTAAEVLDNVPSVVVDVEGNVSLRGSGNVRILINGKPSGLVGISDANGLRNLPANLIERVEVVTNPSARYEAEGMAGIINIILKKETNQGLNGSVDLNAGWPNRYGGAVNLNYRYKGLNLFGSYGANYRKSPGRGSSYQEFVKNDTTFITETENNRKRGGLSHNFRGGMDFYFNEKTVLTGSINYRISDEDNYTQNEYRDYLQNLGNLQSITVRRDDEAEDETNLEYALTFRKQFQRDGHELVADFRYQKNVDEENSNISEKYFTPEFDESGAPNLLQRSGNTERPKEMIAQIDYVHPFGKEGKFEAGLRSSIRKIRNDYLVEEFDNSEWVSLPGLSNEFEYDENIHAGYLIWGNKWGKFSVQGGLRAELSDISTRLIQTNEVNDRNYFNLVPSAHVSYDLPANNAVQISYSRRLSRPRFWDLNPFFSYSDARNFRSGNPNLNPEYTNSFEIGHLKYWDNASLSSSIYYRHTDGQIDRIQTLDDNGNTIWSPQNLATEDSYGLEFTFSMNPVKNWDVDGSFNFFRAITDGGNINPDLYSDTYSMFTRLNTKVKLFKSVDAQLRGNYRAPRATTQGRSKGSFYTDLAMSKDVFGTAGTLTLSVRDIFNSNRHRYITEGLNFYREGDFQWRARQIMLSFNYRINQQKKKQRGERGEGGDFEGGGDDFNMSPNKK